MATIGLDKLYYAKITEDENGDETYGTPSQLAKAMTADLSVELNEATLYADDGAAEIVKEFKSGTLSLGVDDIGNTVASDLTGATIDANKVVVSTSEDGGEPVAVGFRAKKSNGKYRYYWLYRVKFGIPATNLATKGDSITFSTPTIEGTILRRNKADAFGNNQLFIQSHSTLKVTPGTATAKNGASISNYTASCNGVSASNTSGAAITVGKIAKSGSVTVTLTVTDSRGYTASISKTITVIAYAKPKLSSVTLRRTNEIEAEMQLKFNGSISAISVDGTQKNSVQYVRYRYKKTSDASYSSYTSILSSTTRSGTSFSFSNLELCNLDAGSSYDFHLQIQDRLFSLSSLDVYFVVPQGTPLIALRKKKVGINTPNPQATLDVGGDISASGQILMNGYNIMGLVQAAIPDTTNLNDLTAPGIYFRRSTANTSLNYPSTAWGMLEVFSCSPNVVIQRYTHRDGPYTIYIRSKVNSTWGAWVKKA